MADSHIGAWRDPKLKDLSMKAFIKAINIAIERKVDFILLSGDLFNTSLPGIEHLKQTTKKLKELKEKNIPIYIIPGSHDFSPSGKTMIDVLEEAGMLINVCKGTIKNKKLILQFTEDEKTGVKITGLLGKRGMLEKKFYEELDKTNLENTQGTKIFMFHTALTELKPKELERMDSSPISFLPKGFEYYAGGHVHIVKNKSFENYKNIVFPGPLMPTNFSELEKLKKGSFYIYNHGKLELISIEVVKVFPIKIDADNKSPEEIYESMEQLTSGFDLSNTIVLIRIHGKLKNGKSTNINFKEYFKKLYNQKAFFVMKNIAKLTSEEFEEIKVKDSSVNDIEEEIITEHVGQIKNSLQNEERTTKEILRIICKEKHEGEKVYEYEERIKKDLNAILEL